MGGGVLSLPRAGGDGRRETSHHTLPSMGAEVALRWAVVFLSLRSGSRFRSRFAAGSFRVFIPSRWFFSLSRFVRFFLIKVLVSKKKECAYGGLLPCWQRPPAQTHYKVKFVCVKLFSSSVFCSLCINKRIIGGELSRHPWGGTLPRTPYLVSTPRGNPSQRVRLRSECNQPPPAQPTVNPPIPPLPAQWPMLSTFTPADCERGAPRSQ